MISKTTAQFWEHHASLPVEVQRLSGKVYSLWKNDPGHSSLHFKKLLDMTRCGQCESAGNTGRWRGGAAIWWCGSGSAIIRNTNGWCGEGAVGRPTP